MSKPNSVQHSLVAEGSPQSILEELHKLAALHIQAEEARRGCSYHTAHSLDGWAEVAVVLHLRSQVEVGNLTHTPEVVGSHCRHPSRWVGDCMGHIYAHCADWVVAHTGRVASDDKRRGVVLEHNHSDTYLTALVLKGLLCPPNRPKRRLHLVAHHRYSYTRMGSSPAHVPHHTVAYLARPTCCLSGPGLLQSLGIEVAA